ncbi:MAG: proline--tRNA ligase [Verrucomicrobia bacterium]|nr:proline--tRNA ligase [Verrucomicrobiota bacterium]MBS0638012.1 proline--tRNA ligase [Verrucomicrobiota bacterium]
MKTTKEPAIKPTRQEDYSEWFQQVIKAADLAENSPVRGCMVIKPWGWSIWELIRDALDKRIKDTGHQNAYFPLFIPLSFLEKEAKHVEGFAKECAVVTHHRLEEKDGKLIPTGPLEEPLVIRPTSETIIGDAFSRWVKSWRDLPLLINQWANVVRWEMRTRLFMRTAEFLWQEGHTVHANEKEAREETLQMLEIYRELAEEHLAIPVILGEKSEGERFPGAVNTYCFEAMMQDRKALQAGTSHYLGQNFSKAFDIRFDTKEGGLDYGYTTSWGVTTRLIGALIMTHSDDDGLCLPPKVAPHQVVIIPVLNKPERADEVLSYCEKIKKDLSLHRCHIDKRDLRGGEKTWDWIKKGVPVRIEVGPRDVDSQSCMLARRDTGEKAPHSVDTLATTIPNILNEMQQGYFDRATAYQKEHTRTDITTFEQLKAFFTPKNVDKPEIHGGFVLAKWCGDPTTEPLLDELKISIRCLPLKQSGTEGKCVITGRPATLDAIFAKSY